MTQEELLKAIRAEIERKIKMMERNIASLGDGGASISIATYQDVLNIIDSLPDEHLIDGNKTIEEAAYLYSRDTPPGVCGQVDVINGFIAGAKWQQEQMPMPNSTELIAMWGEEEAMLKEKDFRGDKWRLAQNAFMDGFAKGATIDMPMPEDTVIFQKGVAEGKRLMLEDAVEGIVHHCVSAHYVTTCEEQLLESLKRFKDSDKVKVIIVEEDD